MNKKDCENIGYILSMLVSGEIDRDDMISRICSLDPRIKEEFELLGDCRDRDQAVMGRFEEILKNKYGPSWFLQKAVTKEVRVRAYNQAKNEIPNV